MKKVLFLAVLCFLLLNCEAFSYEKSAHSNILISSSIDRQVNIINYEIRKDKRELAKVKASRDLSYNEKKRKIRKLEYEIRRKKRAISKIKV